MIRKYLSRLLKLILGQVVSAVGVTMMYQANIGTDTWNVLHQGISNVSGISFGRVTIIVGITAIAIAVVMGERIGIGTVIGVTIPGLIIDLLLDSGLVPRMTSFFPGLIMLLVGLEILTLGTWLYMAQALGTGPRDSINVAVSKKTGRSVGGCRSAIELVVTLAGWALGGSVGVGTIISAFGIGILFQLNFKILKFDPARLRQENIMDTYRHIKACYKERKTTV